MPRPLAALAVGLTLGTAGCALGRGTTREPLVAHLELRDVKSVDRDALAEKLATQGPVRRPGIAGLFVKDRQRLDPDVLPTDRRRVEAFYRERGFYEARVTDVSVTPAGQGLVDVVFRMEEGRAVRVRKLTVRGLDAAPEAAARLGSLPLREGERFTEAAYDATREAIVQALLSTGWATAEVSQSALVLPEEDAAEVTYEVRAGPRYRFGPIFVAGVSAVSGDRIREEAAIAIHSGDWWDEGRIARARGRIFELGVFGGVRVLRGTPDPKHGIIPVVVAVSEAPFRTVRLGPGVAFELLRWDANVMAGWEHRNFLGDLRRVSADLRAGYTWLPNPIAPRKAGPTGILGLELRQPGAFTRYVDASARFEGERGILDPYDYWAQRLRLGLPVRLGGGWSFVPTYNLEVYELFNYGTDTDTSGAPAPPGGPVLENCRGNICLLTYLEQRLAWDRRDDPVNTRRGVYVSLAVQEGFEFRGNGYRYLRFLPELRAFRPLGRGLVVALRARVGGLIPIRESTEPPVVARFLAGGPLSMRGYYTNRLASVVGQRGELVPVGGNGLADGSLELRFDVTRTVGGALFLDGGNVSPPSSEPGAWKDALDPSSLQFAAGVGLRYKTVFGPIRLDVAARLPNRFCLASDCFPPVPGSQHREPIVAVHLALGEAF